MSLHNTCLTVVPDNLGCRALSLVQTKKILGDFKVDNQPGTVDKRGDKRGRNHGGINADTLEHHGDH